MRLTRLLAWTAAAALSCSLSLAQEEPPEEPQEEPSEEPLEELEDRVAPVERNGPAEELERLALKLGLSFAQEGSEGSRPEESDANAFLGAGFGSWLESQLTVADDSIGAPPPALRKFLEEREALVWRIVGLLETEDPRWSHDPAKGRPSHAEIRSLVLLNRLLLAAALIEERTGRHFEAGSLLEASWSISRALGDRPDLSSHIVSVAIAKAQAGTLRKMSDPPVEWTDRLAGDAPWRQMIEAFRNEPSVLQSAAPSASHESWARAWEGMVDSLAAVPPCEPSKLSEREVWRPIEEELEKEIPLGEDPAQAEVLAETSMLNLMDVPRRTARLLLDRELTLKIVELRMERAASRYGRWPEKLLDSESRVCPGALYEYRRRGGVIELRFGRSMDDPSGGLVLPLAHTAGTPRKKTPLGAKKTRSDRGGRQALTPALSRRERGKIGLTGALPRA